MNHKQLVFLIYVVSSNSLVLKIVFVLLMMIPRGEQRSPSESLIIAGLVVVVVLDAFNNAYTFKYISPAAHANAVWMLSASFAAMTA